MRIERKMTVVALKSVPCGGLASWQAGGARRLGIRVDVAGAAETVHMLELSPLTDNQARSPALVSIVDADSVGARVLGDDYLIDYDPDDALELTFTTVEFKAWRIVVGGENAHLMFQNDKHDGLVDLASGRLEAPGLGAKYGLDKWRIVRVLQNDEREVLFKRGE